MSKVQSPTPMLYVGRNMISTSLRDSDYRLNAGRRPAATARQSGAEMNATYGMSSSEVISQDNSV